MQKKQPYTMNVIFILLIIGILAGFASGLVGIGGGIIIVPALVFYLGLTQHEAQGVSIGMLLLPVGFMAAINYYKAGDFDMTKSLIIGISFVAGAYFGSKVSLNIDEGLMKKIFGVIIFLISLKMIFGK
jgi:uncharacterized membrane protein YfcA